jgi:hypothetical protein
VYDTQVTDSNEREKYLKNFYEPSSSSNPSYDNSITESYHSTFSNQATLMGNKVRQGHMPNER